MDVKKSIVANLPMIISKCSKLHHDVGRKIYEEFDSVEIEGDNEEQGLKYQIGCLAVFMVGKMCESTAMGMSPDLFDYCVNPDKLGNEIVSLGASEIFAKMHKEDLGEESK